jgi:type I restriction-modification system DNA methylase subunit
MHHTISTAAAGGSCVNERKTETLVREALRAHGYFEDKSLSIDEQRSDNPRIKKLLKLASKSGTGGGQPEFVIFSSTYPDFIIVIECKADSSKHESSKRDKFSDYAVDGALLYGSYLSKEYDVLIIGVSGQTKRELKVSHYLQLKGANSYKPVFGNKLLPFTDYYSGYIDDPLKINQDYERLLIYSKELNELLHANKVQESQRSLLISGILIALKNSAFVASFKKHATAQQIANHLVATVIDELSSSDVAQGKLDALRQGFSFIKTHATLSQDKPFFIDLISGIDEHINAFRRTHKYFDTLGQFYIEFLRYANNDKGLGIVLTPPHITDLFVELANVNKNSVVFDNTCGTTGFLISAMRRMVADAKGDSRKVRNIQKEQLIGIEFQDNIYALAVTNMVLHDDGKSNIYQGDCFSLTSTIKERHHPNVGLLNPPYKTKQSDIEELEFVLNNLESLQQGGTCVAIVPISCVLARKGVGLELKQQLLSIHTLEAVLSMPPELFHNSKVGVVSAALIFTAHVPHPKQKKTWFAYCRNDGFEKTKDRGRLDLYGHWAATKELWVNAFRNKDVIPGFSVMQKVSAEDEWCAEAYMETDYSTLTQEHFEDTVRKYAIFCMLGGAEGVANADSQ